MCVWLCILYVGSCGRTCTKSRNRKQGFFPSAWTSLKTHFCKENQIFRLTSSYNFPPPTPLMCLDKQLTTHQLFFLPQHNFIHSLVFTISAAKNKKVVAVHFCNLFISFQQQPQSENCSVCRVACLFIPSLLFHAVSSTHTPQLQQTKEKHSRKNTF